MRYSRSLQVSLTLPYAVLVAVAAALLAGSFWWAGSRSISTAAGQLMEESQNIHQPQVQETKC